MGTYNR